MGKEEENEERLGARVGAGAEGEEKEETLDSE